MRCLDLTILGKQRTEVEGSPRSFVGISGIDRPLEGRTRSITTLRRYSYRAINCDKKHVVGTITIAEDTVGQWVGARYRSGWHYLEITDTANGEEAGGIGWDDDADRRIWWA